MNSRATVAMTLLIALCCTFTIYAFYQQHALQKRLDEQLLSLDSTLSDMNTRNAKAAGNTVIGIKEATTKNENSTADVAILNAAKELDKLTSDIADTIQTYRENLLHAIGYDISPNAIHLDGRAAKLAGLFKPGQPARQRLEQQLDHYITRSKTLYPAYSTQPTFVIPTGTSAAITLAMLTQLEADVLSHEMQVQKHMTQHVGARIMLSSYEVMAIAENNAVAPGARYQARLFMNKVLAPDSARMYCNGQPVEIDSRGIGQVRLRAPTQPGPAVWVGKMRLKINGRDSVITTRVPYRVARR